MSDRPKQAGKRLKGLEEFERPLWSPPRASAPIPWGHIALGMFIGACFGLAFVLWQG